MSRRVFYIVHLDKARILSLGIFGSGLLLTAFATGYRLAGPGNLLTPGLPAPMGNASEANAPQPNASEPTRSLSTTPEASRRDLAEHERTQNAEEADRKDVTLKSEERSRQTEEATERPTGKDRRVNLLDAALPETSAERDLKVYKKKHPEAASESQGEKDSVEKKPAKHRKNDKSEKRKKSNKTENQDRLKNRKKVEKDSKPPSQEAAGEEGSESATPAKKDLYVLQMGAYQSRDAALRLAGEVRKHGIAVYVRKTGNLHTVRTETTGDRDELGQLEKRLRSLHFSPVSVRLKGR